MKSLATVYLVSMAVSFLLPSPVKADEVNWFPSEQGWCVSDGRREACLEPGYEITQASNKTISFMHEGEEGYVTFLEFEFSSPMNMLELRFPSDKYERLAEKMQSCVTVVSYTAIKTQLITEELRVAVIRLRNGASFIVSGRDPVYIDKIVGRIVEQWSEKKPLC